MGPKLTGLYDRTILAHPRLTLFLLALVVAAIGYNAKNFRLDASEDTLILEGDEDLRYFRSISEDYNTPTFLVVTVQTEEDIFSPASLGMLRELMIYQRQWKPFECVVKKQTSPYWVLPAPHSHLPAI